MDPRKLCICLIIAISYGSGSLVAGTVNGIVRSLAGEPLPGAYVQLDETRAATTDLKGHFSFDQVDPGSHLVKVSFMGFGEYEYKFELSDRIRLDIRMEEDATRLEEVTVSAPSESELISKLPLSVSVIEARQYYERSVNVQDLLSEISGVQVRQSGGLGNDSEISIQGLSGKQVKIFINNIPIDFILPVEELGTGAALATIPVTLIDRIEVYKGATPVALSADALGGAINIVTRQDLRNFTEASFARSSFNGLNGSVNLGKAFKNDFFFLLNAQYSSSDNNYRVDDVAVINDFGNPELISVNKFHDRFRSYLINGAIGIRDQTWADLLSFSVTRSSLYDEIQHNFEMRQPYGQANSEGASTNFGLKYEKYELGGRVDLRAFIGFNLLSTNFTDTSSAIYNWRGEILGRKNFGGEITTSGNLLSLQGQNFTGRISADYTISTHSKLQFNSIVSIYDRKGEDPVTEAFYGEDFFAQPVAIQRASAGMGLEQKIPTLSLTSQTSVKIYSFRSEGFLFENGESNQVSQSLLQPGVSQSFQWQKSEKLRIKASYEYATRLPDRIELLGDLSAAINANPGLIPETSHNVNVGFTTRLRNWRIETNGFYRNIDNIIILQAVPPPVLSKHENLLRSSVSGVEGIFEWSPLSWFRWQVNATYQDIRNRSDRINAGVSSDRYFNVRIPNRPFLFGNSGITLDRNSIFGEKDKIRLWAQASFVQKFFRYWEIDGRPEDKLEIPAQWIYDLGLSYTFSEEWITLSLESQNITNNRAFDNFRVQKPGRSYHMTIRLLTHKN